MPFASLSKYGFGGILVTAIALLLTYGFVKKDGKTLRDIGFSFSKNTPINFLKGLMIGCLVAITMFAIILTLSELQISFNEDANIPSVLIWLLAFFPLAYMEEVIFRGYAFTKLIELGGIWPAQILMALLFTWYHDFTGATFWVQLLGPGVWVLIYGVALIWSKGIALPTGLHMGLNIILALVSQKDNREGLWYLDYKTENTQDLILDSETISLIMQICVLVTGIVLTEYFRRKYRNNSKMVNELM